MYRRDYDHDELLQQWSAFRNANPADDLAHIVEPIILDSWARCQVLIDEHSLRLPQRPPPAQDRVNTIHTSLISAGIPYLEDIYQMLNGEPCAVFLTDINGTVLAIEGTLPQIGTGQRVGLNVGDRWAEETIGTNAVGLSLRTAMPVQVIGAEHYLQIFHDYADVAAPVHDEQGAIIGAVAFVTHWARANPSQLALVMATARAITARLQADVILEQANQRLRQLNHILESVTEGVITWDTNGTVEHVNDKTCQILGVHSAVLLGKSINRVLEFSDHIRNVIDERRELTDVETPIRIGDRIVRCVISVRVVRNGLGEVIGGIAMLRTASKVHSWLNQQMNTLTAMTFSDLQFNSRQMSDLLREAEIAARGALPVLIQGENGVGKTTLVQAIHNAGPRAGKPLVIVNCGMVPSEFIVEELLGREVHGDELGRPSKFELADGGTLLFDQIDQLSLEGQQILLSVMNSRSVTRLHAQRTNYVNVRIVATTAQDIGERTRMGGFLPQLYYLFNVFTLRIAPLRERREDILRLTERILERAGGGHHYEVEPEVYNLLQRYPWPGNVRELENVVERAVVHAEGSFIRVDDLPENIHTPHSLHPDAVIPEQVVSLQEAERDAIIRAGWAHQGHLSAMADTLGINRSTLWRKFKQYDLNAEDFKQS